MSNDDDDDDDDDLTFIAVQCQHDTEFKKKYSNMLKLISRIFFSNVSKHIL